MTLHLVKLCVGVSSLEAFEALVACRGQGGAASRHRTRHAPRRASELLSGGSLYWVLQGKIAARQALRDILVNPADAEGKASCDLILEPALTRVLPRPMRPFQGWRYLAASDAPLDLAQARADSGAQAMPESMLIELRALGLM